MQTFIHFNQDVQNQNTFQRYIRWPLQFFVPLPTHNAEKVSQRPHTDFNAFLFLTSTLFDNIEMFEDHFAFSSPKIIVISISQDNLSQALFKEVFYTQKYWNNTKNISELTVLCSGASIFIPAHLLRVLSLLENNRNRALEYEVIMSDKLAFTTEPLASLDPVRTWHRATTFFYLLVSVCTY